MKQKNRLLLLFFTLAAFGPACKKLVDVPSPINGVSSANVYNSNGTAAAVLTGIYTQLSQKNTTWTGPASLFLFAGLSADELTLYDLGNPSYNPYYTNTLTNSNAGGGDFWRTAYPYIYTVNAAIEGVTKSSNLSLAVKQQLLGESYFIRAFFYFYLLNLYGDVPLVTSTNYSINATLARTPASQGWQQVISDLHLAQGLLSPNFLDGTLLKTTTQRTRPTLWAATTMLARAYLYTQNWSGADSAATAVISNSGCSLASLIGAGRVFAMNSIESIWQLQPVGSVSTANTAEGLIFLLPSTGPNTSATYPVYLGNALLNAFEPGDQRRVNWIDSVKVGPTLYYFPYKYQAGRLNTSTIEYSTVLRLAELYLIRAEARAEEGTITGSNSAATDLNVIRQRAGLPATTANSQSSMLTAIQHERQVELFTEWGHRWLDLKRSGTIDAVMGTPGNACATKGGNWNSNWQWYPIALSEITADYRLQQNAGY